jgi:hypothetical protein
VFRNHIGDKLRLFLMGWVLFLFFWFAAGAYAYDATGSEHRCAELDQQPNSHCICSEPFNTDVYLSANGNSPTTWDPADTTAKQCSVWGDSGGWAFEAYNGNFSSGNASNVLSRMPYKKPELLYYLRGAEGHTGGWWLGHLMTNDTLYRKRWAYRWYVYHSATAAGDPNDFSFAYQTKNGKTCENHKFAEPVGVGTREAYPLLFVEYYGWEGGWRYNNDTNSLDENAIIYGDNDWDSSSTGPLYLLGKWVRIEIVVTNRDGPSGSPPYNGGGFRMQIYSKNITDRTPERKVLDTLTADWPAGGYDDLHPPSIAMDGWVNLYRQGTCPGYYAISHYLQAGWDTDEGQRIGSAAEVEDIGGRINPEDSSDPASQLPGVPAQPGLQPE